MTTLISSFIIIATSFLIVTLLDLSRAATLEQELNRVRVEAQLEQILRDSDPRNN